MSNVGLVPTGAKRKVFNAALFAQATKERTLTNDLTSMAKPIGKGTGQIGKTQTDATHPVVRINDLKSEKGDTVGIDIVHPITGKPVMGDKKLAGKGSKISMGTTEIKVDQGRKMVEDGGNVLKRLTSHNRKEIANLLLGQYYNELDELTTIYHLLGARGTYTIHDDKVPLETDPDFAEIMVNDVLAPSYSRHMYAGDVTSFDNLDSADRFSLEVVDNLSLYLKELSVPIRPIILPEATKAGHDPFYLQYVTARQWADMEESATYKDFQQMVANASKRAAGFNHVLFRGDVLMKGNILIRQMPRAVGWRPGDIAQVSLNQANAATQPLEAKAHIHRSVLLGGQAMGLAFGANDKVKSQFNITEKSEDHDNVNEISIAWVNGKQALRLPDAKGWLHDTGRIIVDTAVNDKNL